MLVTIAIGTEIKISEMIICILDFFSFFQQYCSFSQSQIDLLTFM